MTQNKYYYVLNPVSDRQGLTAERYMLRQSGDWGGYLSMQASGAIDTTPFLKGMVDYFASSMKSFESVAAINEGIVLGVSVWGKPYLYRFSEYCLPSLLEKANIAALVGAKARLFIHTDNAGKEYLCSHPILQEIINAGIVVQMQLLNESVLDNIPVIGEQKYWHLGMTQTLQLNYTKALSSDYHLLMPDVVYSAGFFERLFKIKSPLITHSGIPTVEAEICPALDKYRHGMVLDIPSDKIISEALLHAHDRIKPYFVGESRKYPKGHLLIFEAKDSLYMMSPHQTLAFVSKDIIRNLPERFFFTLDSEIEKIAPGVLPYTPTREDALCMLEISADIPAPKRAEVESAKEFCQRFLSQIPEGGLHKLFLQAMKHPLDRSMLGDRWYMDDAEIAAMRKEVEVCLDGA